MTPPERTPRDGDLATRALVGVGLAGGGAAAILVGGVAFWLVCTLIGIVMLREWAGLAGADRRQARLAQYALTVPLALLTPPPVAAGPSFLVLGMIGGAIFFTGAVTRNIRLAFGLLYVGLPVLALVYLRERPGDGLLLTFWAMALVWACDIGAFFAGRYLKGPRLAPEISPSKTWSGLAGGVVAAAVFGAVLWRFAGLPLGLTLSTPLLAVLAQMGDLYESELKRRVGVKDSGNLLPGHGGLMDRLDGLVPVAPTAAFLAILPSMLP